MCVFSKCLHLINPNLNLLNRGGGGGVGLCGPNLGRQVVHDDNNNNDNNNHNDNKNNINQYSNK